MAQGGFAPEYGTAVGIATPQANSTVEPEMHALLGAAGFACTGSCYLVGREEEARRLAESRARGADAILLSGTGMPTLRTISAARAGIPVVSSNLCLAWMLANLAGRASRIQTWLAADAPWRGLLERSSS